MPSRDQSVSLLRRLFPPAATSLSSCARVLTPAPMCFFMQANIPFLQTNTLINHRDSLEERKKGLDEMRKGGVHNPELIVSFLSLYLFNVFWVNIRQEKGRGPPSRRLCRHQKREAYFFSPPSHLILTEAATVTVCHPFDSFCHQLAAKSASSQTRETTPVICLLFSACLSGYLHALSPLD